MVAAVEEQGRLSPKVPCDALLEGRINRKVARQEARAGGGERPTLCRLTRQELRLQVRTGR